MLDATRSHLTHEYADLGAPFLAQTPTTPLRTPSRMVIANTSLSEQIGLSTEWLKSKQALEIMSGNVPWPEYPAQASVYCGHQFGVFVPQLGDGRALLIAELQNTENYYQLQLKGAGPTPYSRQGDGRAVLRSSIREYVGSEALHHLGIPTTRALSLTASSDPVFRETTETAAVVCRVSPSFLRFGHAEYFCYSGQLDSLKTLLQWHLAHQHPDIWRFGQEDRFEEALFDWLGWVVQKTAELMAQWQSIGFCHGVMNTDNMSLLGLTIDYGPYGFMDAFDIDHICNHSDHQGRYSYRNQPQIGHWNMYALAQALSPLLKQSKTEIEAKLDEFVGTFHQTHNRLFARKLGLNPETAGDALEPFIESTLKAMNTHGLDFTRFFRSLAEVNPTASIEDSFAQWQQSSFFAWKLGDPEHIDAARAWLENWLLLKPDTEQLNSVNPALVARNHLLQEVIQTSEKGNDQPLKDLMAALKDPFQVNPSKPHYYAQPPEWAEGLVLSCSS